MLFASNVLMTFAWYGHLKFKESGCSAVYSAAQLKTMQEVIMLIVFAGFSVLYLKEPLGWNHGLGFALIAVGAFFKWS
jgi:uncharacterized protein (DUF486 family)